MECLDNIIKQNSIEQILEYYDETVHEVVKYLYANDIDFNHDGGFSLTDEDGNVIAEAELGIESEKVVFSPYDKNSESAFINAGYKVMTSSEFLNLRG